MAYDPVRKSLLMYGCGSTGVKPSWTEPWAFDGATWKPFAVRDDAPRPVGTLKASIAWDGVGKRMLLFGGSTAIGELRAETWAFSGDSWTKLAPSHVPMARQLTAMAYDEARRRIVLFGGIGASGMLGDTWEWDGADWLQRTPAHSPPQGFRQGMCYDSARQRVVLLALESGVNSALWAWDGTDWVRGGLFPLHYAHIAYDKVRDRVVVFGGAAATQASQDTWEYDGATWLQRTSATSPAARQSNALGYDEHLQRIVMQGGWLADTTYARDTWTWDGSTWVEAARVSWPGPREGHGMAPFGTARGWSVVLFGGALDLYYANDETWQWDGQTWTRQQPSVHPSARQYSAMVYDTVRRRIVLFGGIQKTDGRTPPSADTWEWDGITWQQKAPVTSPPARYKHAMVYDQSRHRTVLVGGLDFGGNGLADHWEWDGTNWTSVTTSVAMGPRAMHAMAYDEFTGTTILFGGIRSRLSPDTLSDTWELGRIAWVQRLPRSVPPARACHAMCFDAGSGRVLLHGGLTSLSQSVSIGDQWEWNGVDWNLVKSDPSPIPRYGHALAFDFERRRPLLFGGASADANDDAWLWSPTAFRASRYGTSCGSTSAPMRVSLFGAPRIGAGTPATPVTFEASGLPASAPYVMALSATRDDRPFGACRLWIGDPFLVQLATTSTTGFGALPLSIPNDPWLRGNEVLAQALALQGSTVLASGGLRIVIGD